jgi:hypothetical protein
MTEWGCHAVQGEGGCRGGALLPPVAQFPAPDVLRSPIRGVMEKEVAVTDPSQIGVSDRVTFSYQGRECVGYVAKKGRSHAYVVCDDQREFRVAYQGLDKVSGAANPPIHPVPGSRRWHFHVSDRVEFAFRGTVRHGHISRLNPTRAHVVCDDGTEYRVPYVRLTPAGSGHPPAGAG